VFSEIELRDKIKVLALDRQKGPTGPPMFIRVLFSGHLNDHRRDGPRGTRPPSSWLRQSASSWTQAYDRYGAAPRRTVAAASLSASHCDTDPVSITVMEDLPAALARQAATKAQCPRAAGGRGAAWPRPAAGDRAQSQSWTRTPTDNPPSQFTTIGQGFVGLSGTAIP
jgi:hypothetical protein